MKIEGVVFDLDGTLTDTEGLQYLGWVEVLKPYGVTFTKEDYFGYAGRQRIKIDAALCKKYKLNIPSGTLARAKEQLLDEWFSTKKLPLMEGALEMIKLLPKKGIKIAVLSNCRRQKLLLKLRRSGLERYFKIRVSLDDVARAKPHPDLFLYACKKLGLKPGQCLAFEDTQAGVESAKAAGLTCFAVPNEYTKGQSFAKADRAFDRLTEAVVFLKTNF